MKICISDKIRIEFTVKKSTSLAWEYLTHQKHITKWWGDNVTLEKSLRKTKRPFPDSSLAARARRALLNEGFPGKPYVA